MDLNKSISPNLNDNFDILEFIKELEERLELMEKEVIYVIDRFEGDLAVCEEQNTKKMININKSKLPAGIKEGSILIFKDQKYILDESKQKEVEERIKSKMNNLWN